MARANICDRCGTVYRERNDVKESRYHVFDVRKEKSYLQCQTYNGVAVGDILDLCDACEADLAAWIAMSE